MVFEFTSSSEWRSRVEADKIYSKSTEVASNGKKEEWTTYTLTGFYSFSDEFTMLLALPYSSKTNIDFDSTAQVNPGTLTTGVGDVGLTARYTLFKKHTLESTWITALLGGFKAPTGTTNNRDAKGNPVDRHALPGTGSFDYRVGASTAYTLSSGIQLTADAIYSLSGPGKWADRDHRFGDSLNFSMKGFYRVYPNQSAEKSVFTFLGLSGEWTGKEKGVQGDTDYFPTATHLSSGGTVLFGDLGVYSTLGSSSVLQASFSKAFYHYMNFDSAYDADPAENYKLDLNLTILL